MTGGIYGGLKLESPKERHIRPTSDKVRAAIMNSLGSYGRIEGAIVIDPFCGTGALSFECLSRGAARAYLYDQSALSLRLAERNAEKINCRHSCHFMVCDARALPPRPSEQPRATLLLLDPPYRKGLVFPAVERLVERDYLASDCWVVITCEPEFSWPAASMTKDYGDTRVMQGFL